MKNFNIICLLMACALIFVAISCVNAADINDSSINAHEDIIMPVQDNGNTPINNQTSISENIDVKNNTSTTITVTNDYKNHENKISNENVAKDNHIISSSGSMTELKNQLKFIRSGSTYTFNKDYSFVKGQDIIHAIVIMGNNLVIDGNGHTIDGKYLMDHFYISGNNVTIKNLTIIHFKNRFNSPIAWTGNNGVLSNCRISENYGVNGGAMEWSGKNGVISNSNFINNTAQKIAGAIYIKGENMTVKDSTFINSTSKIVGEAVYVNPMVKHWKVTGNFNNVYGILDGKKVNINIDFLSKTYESSLNEKHIDIIPLLYKALVTGDVNYLDSNTLFYGRYINNNTYELVIHRIFEKGSKYNGVIYEKHYTFQNVQSRNDIFNMLISNQGHMSQMLIKSLTVNNVTDYVTACHITSNVFNNVLNLIPANERGNVVKSLNVNFADNITINSKETWNPASTGFDVTNINGHHSKVYWKSDDDSENKFSTLKDGKIISISDLQIDGFNTAIENLGGTYYLNRVMLSNNKMDYLIDRDWGAAILNTGEVYCNNCSFINNYAKNGGAIFNQGHLEINNCGFHNNYAYGEGDNICNGKDGVVIVNGKDCSNGTGIVHYAKSYSATQSKWIAIGGTILSIGAGIAAGIITANPVAGFAVGFAVGAGIGAVSAGIIIEHKFDVNYDRATLAANLIISDALSGGFAGYCAGSMKLSMTSATYDGIHPAAPGFGNIISGIVKMCECSINES